MHHYIAHFVRFNEWCEGLAWVVATPPKIFDNRMFVKYFEIRLVGLSTEALFENSVDGIVRESRGFPSMMNQMKEYRLMFIIKLFRKTVPYICFLSPKSSCHVLYRTCFPIVIIGTIKTLKLILNLLSKRPQKFLKYYINFASFLARHHFFTNGT